MLRRNEPDLSFRPLEFESLEAFLRYRVRAIAAGFMLLLFALLAASCSEKKSKIGGIDGSQIAQANSEPHNWLSHGRTYDEQRFSPLDLINNSNVTDLGLAFEIEMPTTRGLEATPLVIEGVIYTTSAWSVVYAIDGRTGETLWKFDPQADRTRGVHGCCDAVNRGLAAWGNNLFLGVFDGRLIALDRGTGKVIWEKLTVDLGKPYSITGAPRVVKGKVIIGNAGGEFGVRGYVSAYEADSGELAWRFYTVPGNPSEPFEHPELQKAAETWTGEWWKYGGGGTVWDSMAFDPDLDLLYIGTGNGSPWPRDIRSPDGGDNLFLSSILALDPDTGSLAWHYQTTPGDQWDYTATQHLVLADLTIDGETRKTIMQAPKNGFFYVLDRETGKLLSADPFVKVTWADGVDLETGRPRELKSADYSRTQETVIWPSALGGHNWQPMSFSPQTGLVYIPANEMPFRYKVQPEPYKVDPRGDYNSGTDQLRTSTSLPPGLAQGKLIAWDPVLGKPVWTIEQNDVANGGVLSTAGNLVFQGTTDGHFVAYDAATGAELWRRAVLSSVIAPPISYAVDGEQFIAVNVRAGGAWGLVNAEASRLYDIRRAVPGRLLIFKLGGTAILSDDYGDDYRMEPVPAQFSGPDVSRGETLYAQYCMRCHGTGAIGNGVLPDLRHAATVRNDVLNSILLDGILESAGMPGFAETLSAEDVRAIQQYILTVSWITRNETDVKTHLKGDAK